MFRFAPVALAAIPLLALTSSSFAAPLLVDNAIPTVVTVNGSGCDHGRPLHTDLKTRGNTWIITYRGNMMVAAAGEGIAKTESRKNCQVNLKVDLNEGYTYAVKQISVVGSSKLTGSDTARVSLSAYFQGSGNTQTLTHELNSSTSGPFSHSASIPDGSLSWAPCKVSRNLNLNTSLLLNSTNNTKSASWVRQDDAGRLTVDVVTKKC